MVSKIEWRLMTATLLLGHVVNRYGMLGTRWQPEPQWRIERYIEAQVWDERPIWEFLSTSTFDAN